MRSKGEIRKELAELVNVCEKTIFNWESEKPELIRLLNLGKMVDESGLKVGKTLNKKEISEELSIDQNTLKNWERNRPKLHQIVMDHYSKTTETIESLIAQLPVWKQTKYFHLIKAELAEENRDAE